MAIVDLLKGLTFVFTGLRLLASKGIRPFVIVPLLINIAVFSIAVWLSTNQLEIWMNRILPSWLSFLEWILWPVFAIIFFFIIFYSFSIIANLISAPFNAILSERVENKLKGLPVPKFQGYKSLPSLIFRTFKSETTKLLYMAKWFILLLLITFIPGLNIISPIAWIILGAWLIAIEYVDYPMGNHELFFKDEIHALKKNKFLALGFGWGIAILTTIPFINFIAMPVGVSGATALWVKNLSKR